MKKRLLMLLSLFMAVTSVGWINAQDGEIPSPFTTQKIDQTDLKAKPGSQPRIGLFANGNAVKIEASTTPGMIKISTTSLTKNVSVEMPDSTTIVFGGGYNETYATTSVTLESGTVYSIVGGGYGTASGSPANSTTTNVHLNGGRVMMFVVGGGAFYSQVGTANIDAKGSNSPTVGSWVLGCIESGAIKDNGKYPEFDAAPCRVDNINLDIQKGTYWIIAIAGGNGHRSFTKVGKAVIKGTEQNPVIIKGGLFGNGSNGRGLSATANVEYCDLSSNALELASVNRGKLETVDFSFKNCTFSDKIYAYLGATYQWGEGYASSEVGIPQNVKFVFDSSCKNVPVVGISDGLEVANVTLIGAKAKVAPFMKSSTVTNTNFKIGRDKVWNFYNGLITENGAKLELHEEKDHNAILNNMYFANGKAITIEAGSNGAGAKIGTEEYDATLQVYGGSYKKDVAGSTNITMNGGTVKNIYGGGYGSNNKESDNLSADVQNVGIKINGGTVSNLVVGGGRYRAKANDVVITVSGDKTSLNNVICGGYDEGKTSNKLETTFDASVNRIANTTFTMTKGTIKGYLFVGGGQGCSYSKTAKATLNGTLLNYGVLGTGSNGRSDNVEVSLTGCTFAKADKQTGPIEIAALNRGIVNNASMTFNNCTFPEKAADYYCYLGATYGYDGKSKVELGNVTMTFDGCMNTPVVGVSSGLETANVTLKGAKASVAPFAASSSITVNAYTIAAGKTWSLKESLELKEGVTLTNKGKLNLPASTIMDGIAVGGTLSTDAISAEVVEAMNNATNKPNLSDKTFSIECKDGVIASNETVAKKLLNEGKVVMVLNFSDGNYSIASFQKILAKITNLPDSVVYGTEPIKLAFNLLGTEVSISGTTSEVVELEKGVLTIKKPGTVTFDLKVIKDTNNDGVINDEDKAEGNFSYDADAANTQVLKVTKRKVTLTDGLTATDKTYDGTKTVTLKKGETLKFSGKLGTDATGLDLASGFKGELTDANAGENKEVIVTAALAAANGSDSTAFYELAPITFVKAKVTPAAATVTAEAKSREYGVENPEFTATTTDLVEGDKLDGILKFTCSATKESLVKEGGYDIVPYGLTSDNYTITFAKGTLTINAVNPVIELTEAKTVLKSDNSAKEIQLKAKLIHAGGVKTITSVKFVQGSTDVTATLGDDGFYTGKFDVSAGATYSVKASATAGNGNKTGESKAISIVVDALTPQEVSFGASVMPTMVYGNEMTLSATSNQAAATGEYTYSVAENNLATIADGKLKATGVGKVTLTVTRAADATHSAAVATKTIEITPKPITVEVGTIEKVYDGTTAITLPTFTLKGAADGVSVNTKDLKLSFASKNAGNSVKVLMPELTLTGDNATNYTLIQPANVTGTINKAPLTVKVKDVTRMWNQRYTKYEFEATGLVNDETLSTAYSGEFKVTEDGSELKLEMGTCPNYDITPVPGILTVELGTPKAVVYGTSSDRKAMIVDEAGYTRLTASEVGEDGYANILDESGKVIGQSLNKIVVTKAALFSASIQTKAAVSGNWNQETFTEIPYGASYEVTKLSDTWTYESTNANVLTVDATGTDIVCTPVTTGKATILAIRKGTGEVKILNLEVAPAELTISVTDMDKTYDGTTLASGTPTLAGADGKDVALDLSGITFNYADKKAGSGKTITPSQPLVLIGSEANNYVLKGNLTGKISKKEVTVGTPLSAYYNGSNVMELTDYASNDRISGDIVPIKVTFDAATVGEHTVNISMGTTGDAANYTLATSSQPTQGNILKSTIVATLPDGASSSENLKSNIKLTVRETGETVTSTVIGFNPTIKTEGSGSNAVHYVNGGETDNYSVVYDKNQIGFKSEQGGDSGSTTVSVSSVSLDKTELTLPRQGTYTLKATINPSDASDKSVTWKSSDESVATVDANGKVTALKVGKATITVTTVDGGKTASCEVTVDFATGLEEALANTQVYAKQGNIYVNPVQPLQLTIVNMIGKVVYNARISSYAQIPVAKGIYIVKLTNAGNTVVTKVNVY